MRAFVFVTPEGMTFQPSREAVEPDIENLQVLGFANGESQEDAFRRLVLENPWLTQTSYDKVFSFELAHKDFEKHMDVLFLSSYR